MNSNKTIKDYLYVVFGSGFSRGISLINTIIIARMLGPKLFGVFAVFYTVMIITWQLPQAFDTIFVIQAKHYDSMNDKNNVLRAAIFLKILYLFVVISIVYPLAYSLAYYYFQKGEVLKPLIAAMVSGGFLTFLMTIASSFQEQERFVHYAFLHAIYTFSVMLSLLCLKVTHIKPSLELVISIYVSISVIIGTVSLTILWQRVGKFWYHDKTVLQKSFNQSKWVFGCTLAFYIFSRIDVLFLTRYLDFKMLGVYMVAAQLIMIVNLMTTTLSGIWLPKTSIAIRSMKHFRFFLGETFWAILFMVASIMVLIIFSPWIVTILYGREYVLAISLFQILLWGSLFSVVYIPFSFLYYVLDYARTRFILEICKILVCIVFLYWFVSEYGIKGGAYAVTLTLIIHAVISLTVLAFKIKRENKELLC